MKCRRCNGLMYSIKLMDKQGRGSIEALVCRMCGEVLDPVITRNRSGVIDTKNCKSPKPEPQWSCVRAAE